MLTTAHAKPTPPCANGRYLQAYVMKTTRANQRFSISRHVQHFFGREDLLKSPVLHVRWQRSASHTWEFYRSAHFPVQKGFFDMQTTSYTSQSGPRFDLPSNVATVAFVGRNSLLTEVGVFLRVREVPQVGFSSDLGPVGYIRCRLHLNELFLQRKTWG